MQYAAKPTTTLVVATGGEGGKGLSPSNKYGRAAGKKISNSCNNNQHTLYSRQNIYSSSQSLREGQEEPSTQMVLLRKDDRCNRRPYHCRCRLLLPLYSRHDIYSFSQSLYQQRQHGLCQRISSSTWSTLLITTTTAFYP